MTRRGSGVRTAQLMGALRDWCRQKRGRQTGAAKILGLPKSQISDWLRGRRLMTGEQVLAVQEFLRNVSAHPETELMSKDPLEELHASLENPTGKKSVWVRTIGDYHHIILGGPNRDTMRDQLIRFMKTRR